MDISLGCYKYEVQGCSRGPFRKIHKLQHHLNNPVPIFFFFNVILKLLGTLTSFCPVRVLKSQTILYILTNSISSMGQLSFNSKIMKNKYYLLNVASNLKNAPKRKKNYTDNVLIQHNINKDSNTINKDSNTIIIHNATRNSIIY